MSEDRKDGHQDAVISVQYEAFPYPPRDPADEQNRLVTGSPSHILELNHYLFGGRRNFTKPFRALVAGGGTGDAAIMLAQQLADTGGPHEVTYIDLSNASSDIARARAKARGLTNIRFVTGSMMDLASLAPGPYDYIDCCGVLHHLEDPAAALGILYKALADHGGMGLMVYAPLGRTGVYPMQSMLSTLDAGDAPDARIRMAHDLLAALPPTNWLKRNPHVADHLRAGDSGLYDLLLHGRDRAYSVSDIGILCETAKMRPVAFIEPIRYDPLLFIDAPALAERLRGLSWLDRCAFAELLTGNLKTHVFYAVKQSNISNSVASIDDDSLAPVLLGMEGPEAARSLRISGRIETGFDGLKLSIPVGAAECDALALIDGRRSAGAIRKSIDPAALQRVFSILNAINSGFLRAGVA
jgi:SAM-dependent methyltransferase